MTRNSAVFAVCLMIAVFLLLINKLARKFIGEVKAHVSYTHFPKGRVSTAPLPGEITLYVEATGLRLVWLQMSKPIKVDIDLTNMVKSNFVLASDLRPSVSGQLPKDYKLIQLFPDTLFFQLEKSTTKRVPVIPKILITFKKQFDFTEPLIIKPDSVELTGPETMLDSIISWKTDELVFDQLDKSVQDELLLKRPMNDAIKIKPQKIRYTIAVEEYTEKTIEVDIELLNIRTGKEINIYPKKVTAIFKVGLSNYEKVDASSFSAVADFSGVDLRKNKYVLVDVRRAPSYIRNLDFSPKSVEYIIYN